jgi:hypothetical protein
MRMRPIRLLLPTLLALGMIGAWAGTSAGQLPPPPTVSLPTITVPSVPLPPAPPPPSLPAVTTPTPVPPTPPLDVPAPTPPPPVTQPQEATTATPAPADAPSSEGRGGASSRIVSITDSPFSPSRVATRRPSRAKDAARPRATIATTVPTPRSVEVQVQTPSRRPYEDEAPAGALGATLETLRMAADAVPPALFALALLAVILLFVAAMPQPLRASWAGAALVHHRGTIAIAGVGVLAVAVLSAGLLL